jgi:L-serine dehydratase
VILPDEIVDTMYKVEKAMHPSLQETGRGGIPANQTGISIATELNKNAPPLESQA